MKWLRRCESVRRTASAHRLAADSPLALLPFSGRSVFPKSSGQLDSFVPIVAAERVGYARTWEDSDHQLSRRVAATCPKHVLAQGMLCRFGDRVRARHQSAACLNRAASFLEGNSGF